MSVFSKLASILLHRKAQIIAVWVLVTLVLSVGLLNIRIQSDPQSLWVSRSSQGFKEQDYFRNHFGAFFRTQQLLFIQSQGHKNIFNKPHLYALYLLQSLIEAKSATYNQQSATLDDLCYKPIDGKGCIKPSPLDFWKFNVSDLAIDQDIQYTTLCINSRDPLSRIPCSDANGIPILKEAVFGGLSCQQNDRNYTIPCQHCWIQAQAFGLTYLLQNNPANNVLAQVWQKDVLEDSIAKFNSDNGSFIQELKRHFPVKDNTIQFAYPDPSQKPLVLNLSQLGSKTLGVEVRYLSQRSIPDQLVEQTDQNIGIVLVSYALMFIYIGINIGKFPSAVNSGFALGLGGILIVLTAMVCSIGLLSYLNLGMTMINAEVVPFLILAIGVDNMFILKNAFSRARGSTQQKIQQTLEEVGPSIVIAAVCEIIAFSVGALTKMPALQTFCIQSAFAVFIDLIFQLTVFVVMLTIDEQRKSKLRLDVFCCLQLEQSDDQQRDIPRKVFENYIFRFLKSGVSSIILTLITVGIISLSFAGLMNLQAGLNQQVSMEYGSDLYNYFTSYKQLIGVGPPAYIVFQGFNYTDKMDKERIRNISDGLSALETVQPPVYSWIGVFQNFINPDTQWAEVCGTINIDYFTFEEQLKMFLDVEIDSACCQAYGICGEQFRKDVVFNEEGKVQTTRLRFQHKPVRNSSEYVRAFQQTRQAVDQLKNTTDEKQAYPYSLIYIFYQQYSFIRAVAIQNLLLAISVVFLAVFVLKNLFSACMVSLMVFLTTFSLVGFVFACNLLFKDHGFQIQINAISVVNLITCVGLSVEFSAHIVINFVKQTGSIEERVKKSLGLMGSSVFVGIVLTKFLGVIVLAFASSILFRLYYFRMYLGIVLLGSYYGLLVLPKILLYKQRKQNKINESTI